MRRGRGSMGATTISGMIQGMKQKAKSGLKKVGVRINKGAEINAVKNKTTGLKNRILNRGKRRNKLQ